MMKTVRFILETTSSFHELSTDIKEATDKQEWPVSGNINGLQDIKLTV